MLVETALTPRHQELQAKVPMNICLVFTRKGHANDVWGLIPKFMHDLLLRQKLYASLLNKMAED